MKQHTGPEAHDGYAEHSHEVRADHRDVPWTAADEGNPAAQALRDALMPYACRYCGAEANPQQMHNPPEHFDWCPAGPDAVANAKAVLRDRILAVIQIAGVRQLLDDLIALTEDSLDDRTRTALVSRVLAGTSAAWEVVPGCGVMTVNASSAAGAVQAAIAERDETESGKGYEPDPNPYYWARRAGTRGPWQRVPV